LIFFFEKREREREWKISILFLLLFPRGELFDGVVLKANADDLSRVTSLSLSLFPRDVMQTFFCD
jgi:hypothetical protein